MYEFQRMKDLFISINDLEDKLNRDDLKIIWTNSKYYEFIQGVPNVILVGLGGSHSYGTNIEGSDIDLRGIYINPMEELIGSYQDSEQKNSNSIDATIYSIKKMSKLLGNCNPNTIEILGLRREDYLYLDPYGKMLVENADIFLSKRAIYTFGNYALSQLNRLVNRSGRANDEILENESRSLEKAINEFKGRYKDYIEYINVEKNDDGDNLNLSMKYDKIPINMLNNIISELNSIHKNYCKSTRNDKAQAYNKLSKHMMHLIRLYMMGTDILKNRIIKTYRDGEDHELLMSIRNEDFLTGNNKTIPTEEFNKLLEEFKNKFDKAAETSLLPEQPDWKKISLLQEEIIERYFYE